MRTIFITSTIAFASLAGCTDQEPDTGTQDQAISNITNCATGALENADTALSYSGDGTYTRSASTINPDNLQSQCTCMDWQADANAFGTAQANLDFPRCRTTSILQIAAGGQQQLGYIANALVPQWDNVSNQTECENSTLEVHVDQWTGTQWLDIWPGTNAQGQKLARVVHPTWNASAQSCNPTGLSSPQGTVLQGTYRLHAKATRGLDANNHGFATVQLWGSVYQ
jgi:hypothetical protein